MKSIVIWGLENTRHSHRFIHQGFYKNFKKIGYKTTWVEDELANQSIESDYVFASGISVEHLKLKKHTSYIFHNVDLDESKIDFINKNKVKYLNLQVFTKDAKGLNIENKNIFYDDITNTLYQPWGTPLSEEEWWPYQPRNRSHIEWWVGSVWNNDLNQGNRETINIYRKALLERKILFLKRGGSRLTLNGLSEEKNANLIRKSKYGATIVGNWQKDSHYIPCRLFKNLTYGLPIISNMLAPEFLKSLDGFHQNLNTLLNFAENESESNRKNRFQESRYQISHFTYIKNIKRIVGILDNGF
jgi:hypothetical protein